MEPRVKPTPMSPPPAVKEKRPMRSPATPATPAYAEEPRSRRACRKGSFQTPGKKEVVDKGNGPKAPTMMAQRKLSGLFTPPPPCAGNSPSPRLSMPKWARPDQGDRDMPTMLDLGHADSAASLPAPESLRLDLSEERHDRESEVFSPASDDFLTKAGKEALCTVELLMRGRDGGKRSCREGVLLMRHWTVADLKKRLIFLGRFSHDPSYIEMRPRGSEAGEGPLVDTQRLSDLDLEATYEVKPVPPECC